MRRGTAMQRHDFDPVAFLFGLAFTGLGALFMVGRLDLFNHARWLWPGLLLLLGIAVLAGARGRGGSRTPGPSRAGSAPGSPPPDLDSIDPPVGPEAFRLPGWPPAGMRREPEPPEEAEEVEVAGAAPADSTTELLPEVDPNAATEVLPPLRPERPERPEPPGPPEPR